MAKTWQPDSFWFGGDYNPEQWPREIWNEDVKLMQQAGVTVATVAVFAWGKIEVTEGNFDFAWLDELMDLLHVNGIKVDLATATASPPMWMAHDYPDILPETYDGVTLSQGSRQHYSPSSPTYKKFAARLVRKMVERYREHPALVAWHINNELGCHIAKCYNQDSAKAFRAWLENRYQTIEKLNAAWNTAFWSQNYNSFEQIQPPRKTPTLINPSQALDFDRFSADALLNVYRAEVEIVRELSPNIPITTNFMGFFKHANYWTWAQEVDFVSDDSYPDPADPLHAAQTAATRDLMRSLGGGANWVMMEQAPNAVNWRVHNAAKPAGMNRLYSMQAVARGAGGVMYFQWRQSKAGAERFHSGIIPHAGTETRVFKETSALGNELQKMPKLLAEKNQAQAAIVFDWESWWALEQGQSTEEFTNGNTKQSYLGEMMTYYRAFYEQNILVDFVSPHSKLDNYKIAVAPNLYITDSKSQQNLDGFVTRGGQLLVGFQSSIIDPTGAVYLGGYLGKLQETLGLWIEEFTPIAKGAFDSNPLPKISVKGKNFEGKAKVWSEILHPTTANVEAIFTDGPAVNSPAVTSNQRGSGTAWYVATRPTKKLAAQLIAHLAREAKIESAMPKPIAGVEVVQRGGTTFVLNHNSHQVSLDKAWAKKNKLVPKIDGYGAIYSE